MQPYMSEETAEAFRSRLLARRDELVEEIRQELLRSDNTHYVELADRVHDTGEEAVADLLSDLDIAEIDRHVKELHDIEAALERIREASYGACIDCGGEIDYARLSAYPTAKRCLECQRHHEQVKVEPGHPTL